MILETGFIDVNGSGLDLINLYERRTLGPTRTTTYISQIYGQDLGSIFLMNANLRGLGLVGTTGTNCGLKISNGTDIGSLFCVKGSVSVDFPTTGLVFRLTFGSSTFPTTDSIGGSTLTPITNASYPSSPAMFNDATRGYVLATDVGTGIITNFVPNTPSWSRCFWLKKNTTGGSGNTLSSLNYPVYFPTLTKIQIDLNYSGPVTTVLDTTDRGLNWVHYVFTYDSTTKVCVLYVNGNAVVNATTGTIATETQSLCIGNLNQSTKTFGANQYFDDIYCYDRALTSTEVFSIYYNGKV